MPCLWEQIFRKFRLNFKHSSLVTLYRSKFLSKIPEGDPEHPRPGLKIPGMEGTFEERLTIHNKYSKRPKSLDNISLAQFATNYQYMRPEQAEKIKFDDTGSYFEETEKTIITTKVTQEPLPRYIRLMENMGYMKLRNHPSVMRIHKFHENKVQCC